MTLIYQNITKPNAHGNPMESITQETQDILQLPLPTNISVTIVPFAHMQIAHLAVNPVVRKWHDHWETHKSY